MSAPMEQFRRTYAEVNHEHLRQNWNEIKKIAQEDRFICPMIKANAYGHGDWQVARTLESEGATHLGVCLIEEALTLRQHGVKADILVFRGFDKRGAEVLIDNQLTPVASHWSHLEALQSVATETVGVHVEFNTGMSRLGFEPYEAEKILDFFKKSKTLKLKAILTHFLSGDDLYLADGVSAQQLKKFIEIKNTLRSLDPYAHVLNSGAILSLNYLQKKNIIREDLTAFKWGFRPGIMLYGYHTSSVAEEKTLRPVLSFRSSVDQVRSLNVGESVSYGGTWVAQRPSQIALVSVGYADGLHRLLSNRLHVTIKNQRVPIVGRVCMDFIMLDVTDILLNTKENSLVGEEVTLFGYSENEVLQTTASDWAAQAQTISYEILTSLSARVPRQHRGLRNI